MVLESGSCLHTCLSEILNYWRLFSWVLRGNRTEERGTFLFLKWVPSTMKFLQSLLAKTRFAGRVGSLGQISRLRFFTVSTEEYSKRNYANNVSEYNTVMGFDVNQILCYLCC